MSLQPNKSSSAAPSTGNKLPGTYALQPKNALRELMFLVTTKRESKGGQGSHGSAATMVGVDDNEGNLSLAHNTSFKACVADTPGTLATLVSSSRSHFSGPSSFSCGDAVAVAQAFKPHIHIYQWGKPQPHQHVTVQEIMSSLASDPSGEFLFGGSRKGFLYVWSVLSGELLTVWQAHYQAVNRLVVSENGQYLVSASDDGAVKVWSLAQVLDNTLITASSLKMSTSSQRTLSPYRSWNAHTLGVTDLVVLDSFSVLRVASVSLDRTLHLYDVHANRSLTKHTLPQPLQSVAVNATFDYLFCGATTGALYRVDCSVLAASFAASKSHVLFSGISSFPSLTASLNSGAATGATAGKDEIAHGVAHIDAHSLAITAIVCMPDNQRVVTASEDGLMKAWSMHTKQLLKEFIPLNKAPITNCVLVLRPESTDSAVHKPSFVETAVPKKYMDTDNKSTKIMVHATLLSNETDSLSSSRTKRCLTVATGSRATAVKGFGKSVDDVPASEEEEEEQASDNEDAKQEKTTKTVSIKEDDGDDEFVPFGEMELRVVDENEENDDEADDEEVVEQEVAPVVKKQRQNPQGSNNNKKSNNKKQQKQKKKKN